MLPDASLLTYFPLCMICSIGWSTVLIFITRVKSLWTPICFWNCAVKQARSSLCSKIHLWCDYLRHYVIAVICKAYSNLSKLVMMEMMILCDFFLMSEAVLFLTFRFLVSVLMVNPFLMYRKNILRIFWIT